jgi:hypothetical protein
MAVEFESVPQDGGRRPASMFRKVVLPVPLWGLRFNDPHHFQYVDGYCEERP